MSVETALVGLGSAAAKSALKLWLGDRGVAADVSASVTDVLAGRLKSEIDRRKFRRLVEHISDSVATRLNPMLEIEFGSMPEDERLAAIEAVRLTLSKAPLTDDDLFAVDLDARHLDQQVRAQVPGMSRDLSMAGRDLYTLLLRESCGYIIEIARGLPTFNANALIEILRRESEIQNSIREVLARLPQRNGSDAREFLYDYRQLVARKLDQIEIFGAAVSDASRRYPLSVAYLSLTAVTAASNSSPILAPNWRLEKVLSETKRLFIRGEAGLGKTTLLQWIAVRSARRDFAEELSEWNDSVPFLIPLRRYADRQLPPPGNFLEEVGRHIADEMPSSWVQQQLRAGRAIVLIDGVDELASTRRNEVRSWLNELIAAFPHARYIVTSRPGAAERDWLREEDFTVADLQPMTPNDVEIFVHRWHAAIREQCNDEAEKEELTTLEGAILTQLAAHNHLRRLSGYPLLCALLCALHRDRRAALPGNRMELYDLALQMLLERRDAERNIPSLEGLYRTEKTLLLSDLAYWLLRNGYTDAAIPRAIEQLSRR